MNNDFGSRVKTLRLKKKMTMEALGISCGFKKPAAAMMVYHYESGRRKPGVKNLVAFADALKCSCDYLCGMKKTP